MNPSLHFSARLAALVIAAPLALAAPIARYALDGTADDSSGNDFHGVVNGATFVEDAQRGTVAAFNGTSGSIDVSASGFSITERPNFQFALSFWFKPEERDDYAPGGAIDVNPIMGAVNSGVIEVVGHGAWHGMGGVSAYGGLGLNSGGGAGSVAALPGLNVYDGEWHHVVMQWQDPDGVPSDVALGGGADATVYLDNQLAVDVNPQVYNGNSGQATPTMVLGGPLVYSNGGPADKYYKGLLSDVRFFDATLTAQEVYDIFQEATAEPHSLDLDVTASGSDLVFTWKSQAEMTYSLLTSTVLSLDPLSWDPVQPDLPATPPLNSLTIPRPGDAMRFYVVTEHDPPPVFSDDFESDLGWTTNSDGNAGTAWERGTPSVVGPATAKSPVTCFGTNLAADYEIHANVWLRSPPINLTDASITDASLVFQQFHEIEADFDFGSLRVLDAATNTQLGPDVLAKVEGSIANWEEVTAALPAEAIGKSIKLEFRFESDQEVNMSGWYIDDVEVHTQ